ncbi:NAD(P)-binding protein [Colletotrichum zoysiae]|uniref:NAD(P)-binding protein n=1 Tax=Colletotrichum zoysiae TaxID=1216348 RepID=A0AAD9HLW3_9PEZI|nr:NAD(P)-binding protein [Colletotrichum zoysiae]
MSIPTWVVVGASRGIGLEFVKQLLEAGQQVVAAVRNVSAAPMLFELIDSRNAKDKCTVEQCDIASEESIVEFIQKVQGALNNGMKFGNVILNAGVLKYPNRATEISFPDFALHLHTNTIGPIICAQKLINLCPESPPPKVIFVSSDSGSTTQFLDFEDGFGAYAASKAALNQMLRHMAAELARSKEQKKRETVVLALHPGEVKTEMANIEVGWEVKGSINAEESVSGMLKVIRDKGQVGTGTFWRWDGTTHPW